MCIKKEFKYWQKHLVRDNLTFNNISVEASELVVQSDEYLQLAEETQQLLDNAMAKNKLKRGE